MEKRIITKPKTTENEIELINRLITENPSWNRSRLSAELCRIWNWCGHDGKPKDISCRDMLRDLDAKGKIKLPEPHHRTRQTGSRDRIQFMLHDTSEISGSIKEILPVRVEVVKERTLQGQEFKSLIDQYHYLGFDMTVGENLKYMVYSRQGKLIACCLVLQPGRARRETILSDGMPPAVNPVCFILPTTPGFWCYPGLKCLTWPAIFLGLSAAGLLRTGKQSMDILFTCWKPLLKKTGLRHLLQGS